VKALDKFFRLPASEKLLLLRAAWLLTLAAAALRLLPFLAAKKIFRRPVASARDDVSITTLCWSIEVAARRIPGCRCLAQALAGASLLRAHGVAAEVVIGVAADAGGALDAHAWVISDGRVLIGGALSEQRFTVLTREVLDG